MGLIVDVQKIHINRTFKTGDRCNFPEIRGQRTPVFCTSVLKHGLPSCTYNLWEIKSLSCILHLNLKMSLNWSGQSKLCSILNIIINRKKRLLLFNVSSFNSLRISCEHFRLP